MVDSSRSPSEAVLQGTIERVTFSSTDTLYAVLRISPEKGYEPPPSRAMFAAEYATAVGKLDAPAEGLRVRLGGKWTEHKSHGTQFEFESAEVLPPAGVAGLVKYLSSQRFEGIGPTLAERIVAKLGPQAFETILADPKALDDVKGLKPHVRDKLVASVAAEFGSHKAQSFLRGLGLGPLQARAILRKLGTSCEEVVRADPYRLAGHVAGIGFATADRIALAMGMELADPRRARAALLHELREAAGEGHSLQPRDVLVAAARERLGDVVAEDVMQRALDELAQQRAVEIDVEIASSRVARLALDASVAERSGADVDHDRDDENNNVNDESTRATSRVYLPHLFHCERALARNLAHLLRAGPLHALATADDLALVEQAARITLHATQRTAVLALLSTPFALLTGGPGVGKTTILRFLVQLARNAHANVLLASPTGRAAKRLAEATGIEAQTVHRLLGWDPMLENFAHHATNPLEADLVVVDEISMLDVVLAHHLVKAVQPPTRLIFVGDPDQLPSVGAGNVLQDLLASARVPTQRLTHIFRQGRHSLIVANAHRILGGALPQLPERGDKEADFYFFPVDDPTQAAERVVEVVTQRIPETFGLKWIDDVQVIAPMYRGECGVDALNERLREALGAGGREVSFGAKKWRTGDRVIHTRNDYEKEVFNGDMGRIERIDGEGGVFVRYPEREVHYEGGELSDLQPAFAITVHRSQGGEFPAVVIPLVPQHWMMLQRNLLYTAITRARRLCVIVGSPRALQMAIDNTDHARRESALGLRLARELDSAPTHERERDVGDDA